MLVIAKVADAAGNKTQLNRNEVTMDPAMCRNLSEMLLHSAKDTITITLNDRLSTFKSGDFKYSVYRGGKLLS